jgi:serine-type D-Ala-D-Ala carboxypeptidase/endopeptidase (penicillin-binding protein 4)
MFVILKKSRCPCALPRKTIWLSPEKCLAHIKNWGYVGLCFLQVALSPAWAASSASSVSAASTAQARKVLRQQSEQQVKQLPRPVAGALRASGLPLDSFGLHVQAVEGGGPLVAFNAERSYILASTAKVVTTLAALDLLGTTYRWRTFAYADGALNNGRLNGDLVIVGAGNATLTSDDMARWFSEIQAKGLREINGNIVLNRYAFALADGDQSAAPVPGIDRPHHMPPAALTLNEGVIQVSVGSSKNGKPRVSVNPPLAQMSVVNQVSAGEGCWTQASFKKNPKTQRTSLVVEGAWGANCGAKVLSLSPLSHEDLAQRALASLWIKAGGILRGSVIHKQLEPHAPSGSGVLQTNEWGELMRPLSVQVSAPLPEVLRDINKTSDNMASRNLMLTMSPGFPYRSATMAKAKSRVQTWLLAQGLAPGDISIDTGSGLSRSEQARPRAMTQLLVNAWKSRYSQEFVSSLPIAGVDGTLAHRMQNGAATGHAYLKTGTLLDTRALAGFVKARSGRVYAVSAMVNHTNAAAGRPALDSLIEWIARNG